MPRRPLLSFFILYPLWWIVSAFLLGSAAFALDFHLVPLIWCAAWCVALVLTRAVGGANWRDTFLAGAGALLLWLALSLLALPLHDFSWDGQAYHQEAILRLAEGWNPWLRDLSAERETNQAIWINAYPKGAWIAEALAFQTLPRLEAAKSVGWMAGLSLAGMTVASVARLPWRRSRRVWALAALFLLNPIASSQWCTFMLDDWVAWALGGAFLAAVMLVYPESSPWPRRVSAAALAAWILVLISVKLTGAAYAFCLLAGLAVVLWRRRRQIPHLTGRARIGPAAILIAALALAAVNPYYDNLIRHGHPLYPAMGPQKRNLVLEQEHPAFLAKPGPIKFLWSIDCYSRFYSNISSPEAVMRMGVPRLKPPFAVRTSELRCFAAPDVHLEGFGPWFGGVFWLGALLLAYGAWADWPGARRLGLLYLAVLASVWINPEAWWVRYVPQAWWLALVAPAATLQAPLRWARRSGAVLIGLLAADALLMLAISLGSQAICERGTRQQIDALRAHPGEWRLSWGICRANRERFREAGLPFSPPDAVLPSPTPQPAGRIKLIRTDTSVIVEDADYALLRALMAASPSSAAASDSAGSTPR